MTSPSSSLQMLIASMPDVAAVGKAAGGLDPQTAAIYFMFAVVVVLLIERGLTGWRHGKAMDRSHASLALMGERFASAIDRMTASLQMGDAQAMAQHAVITSELLAAARDREKIAKALRSDRSK